MGGCPLTRVKICGLTNLDDALAAAQAGTDYLGFIFYPPSPRAIDVSMAAAIAARLRGRRDCPILVGVFVNESAAEMARILDECRLDLAQLSGDEPPACLFDAGSPLRGRAYKALRPSSLPEAEAEVEWFRPPQWDGCRPALLIDAYHPTLRGGTGETAEWAIAAKLALPGLMLAGGLNPENVGRAIAQVRPFAVDVASGVEARPGVKDQAAVERFIDCVKRSEIND